MRLLIVLVFLFTTSLYVYSQRIVEVSVDEIEEGVYEFSAFNLSDAYYTLHVEFTLMTNLVSDTKLPYHQTVFPGRNPRLFRLTRITQSSTSNFNYIATFRKGCARTKIDEDINYLIPAKPEKNVFVSRPSDQYILFDHEPRDSVLSSRKGLVTELKNWADRTSSNPQEANYIEVQHLDCTYSKYIFLDPDAIFVKLGDYIEAGDLIGLVLNFMLTALPVY